MPCLFCLLGHLRNRVHAPKYGLYAGQTGAVEGPSAQGIPGDAGGLRGGAWQGQLEEETLNLYYLTLYY